MSCSPEVEPFLEALWLDALADAEADPDRYHLLAVPGAAVSGHIKAATYPPGRMLIDDPEDIIRGSTLAEANLAEHQYKHRIAIFEDIDEDDPVAVGIAAGKLRHEIRHGEQRERCGQVLFDLDDMLYDLILAKVGGLPGSALWYQLKPIEADANAASARFLRRSHPEVIEEILVSDDAPLARSKTAPGALDHLPAKTVAAMFGLQEVAHDPATWGGSPIPFENRLRAVDPRAARLWADLSAAG